MKVSSLISAESIGTLAVVLSLIFVGIEIRDGNRETRAATTQAALDAEMAFQAELIENSDVWERVVMGGDYSDEVELRRATALFNMSMTLNDNRFQMMESGYIEYSAGNLPRIVTLPFYEHWRESIGASGRSEEFLEYVDDLHRGEISQ